MKNGKVKKIKYHLVTRKLNVTSYLKLSSVRTFGKKARFVAARHMTEALASLTYSTVVSRDFVQIILLIAVLNGLELSSCDIQNAYLTALCR